MKQYQLSTVFFIFIHASKLYVQYEKIIYLFVDLLFLNNTFNSVIKLLGYLKINFKWELEYTMHNAQLNIWHQYDNLN